MLLCYSSFLKCVICKQTHDILTKINKKGSYFEVNVSKFPASLLSRVNNKSNAEIIHCEIQLLQQPVDNTTPQGPQEPQHSKLLFKEHKTLQSL